MTIISSLCSQFKADFQETPKNKIFRCQIGRSPLSIPSKLMQCWCLFLEVKSGDRIFHLFSRKLLRKGASCTYTVSFYLGCCIVVLLLFTFQVSWRNGCLQGLTADRVVACVSTQSLSFIELLKYKNTKWQKCTNVKIQKVEMLHIKDTMEFKQNCFKSAWTFQFF